MHAAHGEASAQLAGTEGSMPSPRSSDCLAEARGSCRPPRRTHEWERGSRFQERG